MSGALVLLLFSLKGICATNSGLLVPPTSDAQLQPFTQEK